jgi:hypothetical protein
MVTQFRVIPQLMFGFLCKDFRETYSIDWHYVEILLSPKSASKYGGAGKNSFTASSTR